MPKKKSAQPFETLVVVLLLALLGAQRAGAEPLSGSQEIGASISDSYGSRNVFTNPAAFGFETALNGADLLSSFSYGINQGVENDYSLGLSLGYFGAGWEGLSSAQGRMNRFRFAVGVPITSGVFLGARYALTRSDSPLIGNFDTVDLGLQFRPFPFLSLGLLANGLNQPVVTGTGGPSPIQFVGGLTVRPVDRVEISFDTDTSTNAFAQQFGYQANVGVEPLTGLTVMAGYHSVYHFQAGLQLNLGRMLLFSHWQPGSSDKNVVSGIQLSPTPYPSSLHPQEALEVTVDSSLGEEAVRGGLFSSDRPSLLELLLKLQDAGKAGGPGLVVIRLEGFPLGLAAAEELHEAIWKLRQSGSRIEVLLGQGSIKEYLIASAANRILMEPSGELRFLGPRSERYFLKGTMDKIGIEGEFLAKGEYKSAPEMFTRKDSSAINRDAELAELRHVDEEILPLLSRARGITSERWHKALGTAIYSADDAKSAGLIDGVEHADQEMERIHHGYYVIDSLQRRSRRLSLPSRISVVVARGDILEKRVGLLSFGGEPQITPNRMESHLRKAASDCRTKAIVLRVCSPGGEVLASDEIAAMVESAKRKKPVTVSMGDVAASGGYMISAPGGRIFADPLTVTGSIGVFLGKFNLSGLYKKIDLQKEILSYAPFASLYSEDRPLTAEGRQVLLHRLDTYYDGFVSYVAKARNMSKEQAESAAKGRVWLGEEARKLKLTDEKGGIMDAIAWTAKQLGLGPDDYEVVEIESEAGLFQFFGDDGFMMARAKAAAAGAIPLGLLSTDAARSLRWMASLKDNPFLYLSPVERFE